MLSETNRDIFPISKENSDFEMNYWKQVRIIMRMACYNSAFGDLQRASLKKEKNFYS